MMGSLNILLVLIAVVQVQSYYYGNDRELPPGEDIIVTNEGYQPIMADENNYGSDGADDFNGSLRKRQTGSDMIVDGDAGDEIGPDAYDRFKEKINSKWGAFRRGFKSRANSLAQKLAAYTVE